MIGKHYRRPLKPISLNSLLLPKLKKHLKTHASLQAKTKDVNVSGHVMCLSIKYTKSECPLWSACSLVGKALIRSNNMKLKDSWRMSGSEKSSSMPLLSAVRADLGVSPELKPLIYFAILLQTTVLLFLWAIFDFHHKSPLFFSAIYQ